MAHEPESPVSWMMMAQGLLDRFERQNEILEELVDEIRLVNGRTPAYEHYTQGDAPIYKDANTHQGAVSATEHFKPAVLSDGDYAGDEFLKEFARHEGLYVDDLTDIRGIARERGWVDKEGRIVVGGE